MPTALLPFEVHRKIADGSHWLDRAPHLLLSADAACQVVDGIKRKRPESTTGLALDRITGEMRRLG